MRTLALSLLLLSVISLFFGLFMYPPQIAPWWDCRVGINSKNMLTRTRLLTSCLDDPDLSHKDRARVHFKRGFAFSALGDEEQAFKDFSASIRLYPDKQDAHYNRGVSYMKKQQYDLALHDFDRAIELKPSDASALQNRALIYMRQGRYDDAMQDVTKAIKIKPKHARARDLRARLYGRQKHYRAALSDLDIAIQEAPNYPLYYSVRGFTYYYLGDLGRAIDDAAKTIRMTFEKKFELMPLMLRQAFDGVDLARDAYQIKSIDARRDELIYSTGRMLVYATVKRLKQLDREKRKVLAASIGYNGDDRIPFQGEMSESFVKYVVMCTILPNCHVDLKE